MKIKNVKLEWYILQYDFNKKEMKMYNIFGWSDYPKQIAKAIKSSWFNITDYESFKEYIKYELIYHFWSKTEAEFKAGDLFAKSDKEMDKIDGWFQIEPNLDNICNMIINKMDIKFK